MSVLECVRRRRRRSRTRRMRRKRGGGGCILCWPSITESSSVALGLADTLCLCLFFESGRPSVRGRERTSFTSCHLEERQASYWRDFVEISKNQKSPWTWNCDRLYSKETHTKTYIDRIGFVLCHGVTTAGGLWRRSRHRL